VQHVPCPHCHRYGAEVRVERSPLPILVEPTERTEIDWRVRRALHVFRVAGRVVRIRAGQSVRAIMGWWRTPTGGA
jgi:hypothetical protein